MAYNTDIERLNYYEGEFLGAVDFQAEQEYYLEMRRRHNLGQHTWGIVTGLELAQAPNGGTDGSYAEVDVYLQPGMAVDGFGREIAVLSQVQLTQEMFAAFYNPSSNASPVWAYVWISYQEALLNPPSDACNAMNNSDAFARIQETYTLTATVAGAPPVNSMIVVDGIQTTPPSEPSSASGLATISPPADPPPVTLPYDDSVPFQEFPTDDSTLIWWIPLGRVKWDPHNEVFLQINSDPVKSAIAAGAGREYVGNVSQTAYAPAGIYTIVDRNSPYPALPSASDPNLGGVQAEVAGSLQVDYLLNAQMNALVGGAYDSTSTTPLSPLTIIASPSTDDQQLIQFRDPTDTETWYINQMFDGSTPGFNIGEVTAAGNNVDNRIFVQPTQTSSSLPSPRNVGIGTSTPRNPLAIRGQGAWWELLSFEDNSGNTKWHINHNPQGTNAAGVAYTPGMNFSETGVADFRLFLQTGGSVGIGTQAPLQNLSVNGGLNIDQQNLNPGGPSFVNGPNQMLTFGAGSSPGAGSGEGIGSCRVAGVNQYGLDFYTGWNRRMTIDSGGTVTMTGDLHVAGVITSPNKTGCVEDRFINRDGIKLERGDVVVLHPTPSSQFYGSSGQIPLVEVRHAESSVDPCVCGIVDEPALPDAKIRDLDRKKLGQVDVGLMVTLGAYAYCKVDADIAPISPGDRLTTSHTPGYAQKLDPDEPAQPGTVIGKAMGSLQSGKGIIPVFVSHQ